MATQVNQQDLDQPRKEALFTLPAFLGRCITKHMLRGREAKNLTMVYVMVNVLLTTVPMAILQFYLEGLVPLWTSCVLGIAYITFTLRMNARSFILALHFSTHSPVFRRKWNGLRHLNSSLICNFFGIPIWCYYAHHVVMHHDENNLMPHDVSSTMPYRRDSRLDHWRYILRYVFFAWFELPYHLMKKGNLSAGFRCILGVLIYVSAVGWLVILKPVATHFVFILPALILSYALMEGNWKQHIFVDPDDPDNPYKSTYTCINTSTNALNFNDGYHVEHHVNPNLPWYM
ncbi:MAG: fatty acid desaturase, partial [Verrucomicrobiae bacterium]|nr:fatty acid desaturase [Verrucomicrobiae bacterium]